jgi:hypothetical protein
MTQFCHSYLFAYLTILGVPLGCLGLLLLHSLVGGAWGDAVRDILQAGADTLPWLAVLFIPILLGLHHIYPWMDLSRMNSDSFSAGHKRIYFQVPFFILRAICYFVLWSWIAYRQRRSDKGSGVGLLMYVFTVSFASFDWIMSLEPNWSSSIYGVMLMIGDVLSGLAFTILALDRQSRQSGGRSPIPEDTAHDLGNLLLAFVMLWAYMALSQYLIIWSANLPEEIGWYLARQRGGWQWVAIVLILFQFALPFALLLSRQRKRKLESLAAVAAGILVLRVIDVFWLTAPDFSPGRFSVHILDGLLLLVLGGTWTFFFRRSLEKEEAA